MFRTSGRLVVATFLPSIVLLAALAVICVRKQVPIAKFMHDPTALARISPFTGVVSNLGILLWCASAAVCMFAGLILYYTSLKNVARFLIASGLITLVLLFDDLLQIHEILAPYYLGLSEKLVYVIYALAMIIYLLVFRRFILQTGYALLCCAFVFFAISMVIDTGIVWWHWKLRILGALPEDGPKFLGIASWCAYYMQVSFQALVDGLSGGVPGVIPTIVEGGIEES